MELKQLHIFLESTKTLNFTKAADNLGYTQANVTIQIRQMEEELHTPLFNRIGKSITLTEAGSQLVPLALKMIQMEEMILNIDTNVRDTGSIRIGVCDSLCVYRLPRIIYQYKQHYPNVNLSLTILKCSEFYSTLANNQIDLAFTIGYLQKEKNIHYTAERKEKICVLASKDHALTKKHNLTPNDFSGVPLILAEPAAYYRQKFLQELIENNITPQIMVETESIQAIKKLTEQGLGVCIMPKIAAIEEINSGILMPLDYTCDYGIHSHIIWHTDKYLSPCQEEFIRMACEQIADTNY